jgi:RNA-binding protein YhbY
MKNILYLLIAVFLTACGGSNLPEGVEYSIIKEDPNELLEKTNIEVRINKKVDEQTLKIIANELKDERGQFKNVWIFYYVPDKTDDAGVWATSHFSPELKIEILGSTEVQDKEISKVDDIKGDIIGKWRSEKSLMGATIILYKNTESKQIMSINWKTGNPLEEEITESTQNGLVQYLDGNENGEYYLLEKNGNLGMYGKDGKFDEAVKIK